MPLDWIRMRTDLYRDPKVIQIADMLMDSGGPLARYVNQQCMADMTVTRNVMRNVTVGALVSVWGITRHQGQRDGDDLVLKNVSLDVIDDIAELPGIGEAMAGVGWVVPNGVNLTLPRFFTEHNSDPIEAQRKQNRDRQARYRDRHKEEDDSNVTVTQPSRTEERRGEKRKVKEKTAQKRFIPPTIQEVTAYCEQRAQLGKPRIDPEKFMAHYEANGWIQGQGKGRPVKKWQACVWTWEKLRQESEPTSRVASPEDRKGWTP